MASDLSAVAGLVNEIHWLSAEMKKRTALRSEQERVLLASKGLLHTLAEQGPRTVPAIAQARNTSRQNIQIIANRLAELGCVEFVPNPLHKKSDLVRLTASGDALLKSSTRQESTVLDGIAGKLKPEQIEAAAKALLEFHGALTTEKEPHPATVRASHEPGAPRSDLAQPKAIPLNEAPATSAAQGEDFSEDDSLPVNLL